MKFLYCHDNIYIKTEDGHALSEGQFSYDYWDPYIKVCDELIVMGRGRDITDSDDIDTLNQSNGEKVSIETVPNMNTPLGLLLYHSEVKNKVEAMVDATDAVIIRTMSEIGWLAFKHAKKTGKPIAHEVAGCAWDNTWNHGSLLGKAYAPIRAHRMKQLAQQADFVLYVSKEFLPKRYPAKGETAIASNVRIETPHEDVLKRRWERIKSSRSPSLPIELGLIGQLNHKLKGISVAIEALSILNSMADTKRFSLKILGAGQPSHYRHIIHEHGLENDVRFDGVLASGTPVLKWLDRVDIYVQPSFHEGVPRATIEAMSRGCPAFGSDAGGIPELLSDAYIHKAGDAQMLAQQILKNVKENTLEDQARTNFEKACEYTQDKLQPIRDDFWSSYSEFVKTNKDKNQETHT